MPAARALVHRLGEFEVLHAGLEAGLGMAANGDGIDVESCKNVLVENSTIDAGDDGICVKSGRDEEGRRIYELTEKGRKMMEERWAEIGRFFEDDDEEEGTRDRRAQMRDSASRLMQAVSQLGYTSKPESIERVRELLDKARKEIYEVLATE